MITQKDSYRLKMFAICMIICHHLSLYTEIFGGGGIKNYLSNMGSCNVFLFLFLSGYGLTASQVKWGTKHYLAKKLDKIYFPYLFVTLMWIALTMSSALSFRAMVANLMGIHVNFSLSFDTTMWFLSFLFVWYFLFWVIIKLRIKTHFKLGLLFSAGFLFTTMWPVPIEYAVFFQMCRWVALSFPLGVLFYFAFSGVAGLRERIPSIWRRIAAFILGLALLVPFHIIYLNGRFDDHTYRLTGLLWSLGWIFLSLSIPHFNFTHPCPPFVKQVTALLPYAMYLTENKIILIGGAVNKNLLSYFAILIVVSLIISGFITLIRTYEDLHALKDSASH